MQDTIDVVATKICDEMTRYADGAPVILSGGFAALKEISLKFPTSNKIAAEELAQGGLESMFSQ